jgi:hypothetical protein
MNPPISDTSSSSHDSFQHISLRDTPGSLTGSFSTSLDDPTSALCSPEQGSGDYPFIFESRPFQTAEEPFSQSSMSFSGVRSTRTSKEFTPSIHSDSHAMPSYQSYVVHEPEEELAFPAGGDFDYTTSSTSSAMNSGLGTPILPLFNPILT